MRLKELLDSPEEFSPFKNVQGLILSFFRVKDKDYVGAFHKDDPSYTRIALNYLGVDYEFKEDSNIYSFAFGLIPEGSDISNSRQIMSLIMSQSVLDSTTNTGDAASVFSTVAYMCKDFFAQYHPNGFYFGAKEQNRLGVYDILCRKLVAGSNEYEYTKDGASFFIEKK
jgi:hypothetical protein